MSVATARLAFMNALSRMAKQRQAIRAAIVGGTDYWDRADAGADETYENRIKGTELTTLDAAQALGSALGAQFTAFWNLHNTYIGTDLLISGSTPLEDYLDTYSGQRIPFDAAAVIVESLGTPSQLSPEYVFPKGTRPNDAAAYTAADMTLMYTLLGTAGNPTPTPGTDVDDDVVGGAVIMFCNALADTTVTDLVLACTRLDDTIYNMTCTVGAATQYKQSLQGGGAVGVGGAAAGQADVLIKTSVAQFKVGEWVLIVKATGVDEFKQIKAIPPTTAALTIRLGNADAETPLLNTLLEDDMIYPTFKSVAWVSGTVANTKTIHIYAYPDRQIAL